MSFIFRQQNTFTIGPVGVNTPIDIPVVSFGPGMQVEPAGAVRILEPGTYMANWSVPCRIPIGDAVTLNPFDYNLVVTLNNITNGTILGKSATNIAGEPIAPGLEEISEVVSGSAIFTITNPTLIQLVNSSAFRIIVPIHAGGGAPVTSGGATFTIHRIGPVASATPAPTTTTTPARVG